MNALKDKIKELANEQLVLKNQRKTVNLVGERTMETWKATMKHFENRIQLRHLYLANGILNGKTIIEIEINSKIKHDQTKVDKLVKQYGEVIHTD